MNPPRIRAQSFQFESPTEWKDKWGFEISMWSLDGETRIGDAIGMFGPFDTQEMAVAASKDAAKLVCEDIEKRMTGEVSGKYLDLKNGAVLRSWMEN